MKITSFTYTKPTGDVSQRTLITFVFPSKAYEGICIDSLEAVDQVECIDEMNELHETYMSALNTLYDKYDLKNDYRRFLAERMTNVVTETI